MLSLVRSFTFLVLLTSCTQSPEQFPSSGATPDSGVCADGQEITHSCANADGSICESIHCIEGNWECPEGLMETFACITQPTPEPGVCVDGQEITHSCASADGSICESIHCIEGNWECPEGLMETFACIAQRPTTPNSVNTH